MDKEREIRNFKSEEYWNLSVVLKKQNEKNKILAKFYGKDKKIELTNEKDTLEVVKKIDNKEYKVIDVIKKEKKKNPAAPFTTSTLQQEASRKLGFAVKKTMMVAQKLYESGLITYMRTDSVRISEDALNDAKNYIIKNYGKEYYNLRTFKTKDSSQDAHEAIRPTDLNKVYNEINNLGKDESKLLSLIFNRFLASQMSVSIYDTTKIVIDNSGYIFNANGSVIKFDGFMKLYIEGSDETSEDDEEGILPDVKIGEILSQDKIIYEQKFTEPPFRYTEASLVKVLEEKGIGRPSTYAPTISTIEDRLYIEKEKKFLVPTNLGEVVNEVMEKNFTNIVDEKFTKNMEDDLDKIAIGKNSYIKVVKSFFKPFIENLNNVSENMEKVKLKEEVSEEICENCGKNMIVKTGRYGKFLACPGYPECKNIKSIVNKIDVLCPKCGGSILIKKTKAKKTFYVCENSPKTCDYISWNKPKKNDKK
jgi:DNA topoisomerase I